MCSCMRLPTIIFLILLGFGVVALWSLLLDDDHYHSYARCDNCHCITTSERCPVEQIPFLQYSSDTINLFEFQQHLNPYNLTCNPFNTSPCRTDPMQSWTGEGDTAVCAIKYEQNVFDTNSCPSSYTLKTYGSLQNAYFGDVSAVTHMGSCGVCSSTQDLAVLMRIPDMETQAKKCIKKGGMVREENALACFKNLGLSPNCAFLWHEYARANMRACFFKCLFADLGDKPFNDPDSCELNKCLQCQKEKNQAIFERIAGRTYARSALLSSVVKECDSVAAIEHDACPTTALSLCGNTL